jgi:hypothetical protein
MISQSRWGRTLRFVGVAFIALLAVSAAYVQIQQRILRWRAEQLLADIREIQMGKSTWADAQRLMTKWGAWGEWQGDCTEDCEFRICIDDASHALHRFPVLDGGNWGSRPRWPQWMNRPYGWAGGRFAVVEAEFDVRHGVIWSKSFAVLVTPFPERYDSRGELIPASRSSVIGQARGSTSLFHGWTHSVNSFFSPVHPEMSVFAEDDDRGHWAVAQFTPFVDENTIRPLLDFNLECLSRWKDCRSTRELMPTAVPLFEAFRNQAKPSTSQDAPEGLPLWILARDLEYVAIGELLTAPLGNSDIQHPRLRSFRVVKLLKGYSLVSDAGIYMVGTVGSDEKCSALPKESSVLNPGTKVLMAFNEPLNQDPARESDFSPCVVVPMTAQNLAAAERGIARDTVLRDSAVY